MSETPAENQTDDSNVEACDSSQILEKKTAASDELSATQSTENFIETYHAISEWIRFGDAKAAVILTVGAAMAGFLIPTVQQIIAETGGESHLIPAWKAVCLTTFGVYLFFFLLSGIFAFLCINPLTKKGKHPSLEYCKHFHPAAVSNAFKIDDIERFVEECDSLGAKMLRREVQAAILLDSHISSAKYSRVRKSLFYFSISVAFGFVYFVLAQL